MHTHIQGVRPAHPHQHRVRRSTGGPCHEKAGVRSKREAVEVALRAFVQEADYASLLALRGSGGVAEGYDPKASGAAKIIEQ
jgi:hypothetical protein